ncbi:lipopolysaccharide biosynthesis protein [Microlunatus flavus]|uniref:Polysaccharide transporter, PST family n=1 Tax=Microlunatus flavus TaxID=1036181 RepID=A0A1H9DH13_9ACTN|nr:lipopolysaccharide biosynthesis protein [Microlunatus flavus]SEQ12782.1 polysaccharide transporter, PST family [Microlunatus flavus]
MTDGAGPSTAAAPSAQDAPAAAEPTLARSVGRGAAWALAANITMRFASVAVTAILARLLSKEDFGIFAVALAVYLVVASLAELGMASAVARSPLEPEEIAPTISSISILASVGIAVLMASGAPLIASALGQPGAAQPIRILALCLVLTGVFAVPGAQLVREFRQDKIFLGTVVGFLVANPLLVLLALHGGGATAFAWSRVVGQLATGLVFVLSTSRRYWPRWRREVVRPLLRFGLPLSLANLVNWTLLNADYMILGRLVDAAQIGVYVIAFNVANWSTAVLGSVLNSVVVPAFGRVADDRERLGAALTSSTGLVAAVALPTAAISAALSRPLVDTVFGARWAEAAPVLVVLAGYGALYAFSLLFANVLVATGQTVRLLLIQLGWVVVLVPGMVLGEHWAGLRGVAWAHVVTIGLIAVPAYGVAVVRATGRHPLLLLRAVVAPLVAATLAAAAARLASQPFTTPWLALLVGCLAGGVVYALAIAPMALRQLPDRFVPGWVPGWALQARREVAAP